MPWHAPVFLLNSRLGRFSAAGLPFPCLGQVLPAPLIPKLRGHFAEFLFRKSLEHLRLLASPTCVGLRYGQLQSWSAKLFSTVCVSHPWRGHTAPSASVLDYPSGFAYRETSTTLQRKIHHPPVTLLLCPSSDS
jgi:hypothetical protein